MSALPSVQSAQSHNLIHQRQAHNASNTSIQRDSGLVSGGLDTPDTAKRSGMQELADVVIGGNDGFELPRKKRSTAERNSVPLNSTEQSNQGLIDSSETAPKQASVVADVNPLSQIPSSLSRSRMKTSTDGT